MPNHFFSFLFIYVYVPLSTSFFQLNQQSVQQSTQRCGSPAIAVQHQQGIHHLDLNICILGISLDAFHSLPPWLFQRKDRNRGSNRDSSSSCSGNTGTSGYTCSSCLAGSGGGLLLCRAPPALGRCHPVLVFIVFIHGGRPLAFASFGLLLLLFDAGVGQVKQKVALGAITLFTDCERVIFCNIHSKTISLVGVGDDVYPVLGL